MQQTLAQHRFIHRSFKNKQLKTVKYMEKNTTNIKILNTQRLKRAIVHSAAEEVVYIGYSRAV
jgi:hypothetical protein